jgi:hypothetical protein
MSFALSSAALERRGLIAREVVLFVFLYRLVSRARILGRTDASILELDLKTTFIIPEKKTTCVTSTRNKKNNIISDLKKCGVPLFCGVRTTWCLIFRNRFICKNDTTFLCNTKELL